MSVSSWGDRGRDGGMAASTQGAWVWASSGRWWRTGKPGVLQLMRLQSHTQLSGWTTTTTSMDLLIKTRHGQGLGLSWAWRSGSRCSFVTVLVWTRVSSFVLRSLACSSLLNPSSLYMGLARKTLPNFSLDNFPWKFSPPVNFYQLSYRSLKCPMFMDWIRIKCTWVVCLENGS